MIYLKQRFKNELIEIVFIVHKWKVLFLNEQI